MGNLSETEKLEGRMFRVVVVEVTYVYKPFGIYQVHPPNAATYFSLFPGIGEGRRRGGGTDYCTKRTALLVTILSNMYVRQFILDVIFCSFCSKLPRIYFVSKNTIELQLLKIRCQ